MMMIHVNSHLVQVVQMKQHVTTTLQQPSTMEVARNWMNVAFVGEKVCQVGFAIAKEIPSMSVEFAAAQAFPRELATVKAITRNQIMIATEFA
jgi:aerobic-type carbon monoxide dehydrogenase small subunit (CoxS/CutS family)